MTTSVPLIGVTGSTGQLGSRVATRLATLGRPQRLLVRDIARAPQLSDAEIVQAPYEDGPLMRDALSGVQVLFLISGYGQTRVEQHYSAIDAAIAAGVERIVYTSFLSAAPLATFTHAREHYLTEQHTTGFPASYHPETIEKARASRAKFNPSDWELEAWVSTYVAIATGEMSVVSHTVEVLIGHVSQTLTEYVHKHPESYQHITANQH
jgi:hypothetical protein